MHSDTSSASVCAWPWPVTAATSRESQRRGVVADDLGASQGRAVAEHEGEVRGEVSQGEAQGREGEGRGPEGERGGGARGAP